MAFSAAGAHCWLVFSCLFTRMAKSFSAKLPSRRPPLLELVPGAVPPRGRTWDFPLFDCMRFLSQVQQRKLQSPRSQSSVATVDILQITPGSIIGAHMKGQPELMG